MSTDFNQLIQNLKNDLKSLPSVEGCLPEKNVAVSVATKEEDARSDRHPPFFRLRHHQEWAEYIVRHYMITIEFFLFFFILLLIIKPGFLYIKERKKESRHEMVATRFSGLNLLFYSGLFTALMHTMIFLQRHVLHILTR